MNSSSPIALITGAGSGIGRALAHVLTKEGYTIAALDCREDGLRSLADELETKAFAWRVADVTDPAGLKQAVHELETQLAPIDLLVANAGIGLETTALDYNIEAMNRVMNINLLGVSNSIGVVLPGMIQRKRGHLVAISSIASYRGLPRMLGYCASKAGVNAIMDGLRVELKSLDIQVTTICPGFVRTPMTDKLQGKLEDLIEVETAAAEIAYAIRRRLRFYSFPRSIHWKLRFFLSLPLSWQDALIGRKMHRITLKKPETD